jgi:hypothetical protein
MFLTFNAQFMKRFQLLFIISLLISFNAYPQLNKKIWLVGGNGSFQMHTQDYNLPPLEVYTYNTTKIEASSKVGYFVIDKLVFGVTPTYSYVDSESVRYGIIKNSGFSIGPFGRYYFLDKYKLFNILAEVNYQIGMQSRGLAKVTHTTNNFSFLVGPEIFINTSVGIEILLGYKVTKATKDGSENPDSYIDKGFQVAVGLQIHLENFNKN